MNRTTSHIAWTFALAAGLSAPTYAQQLIAWPMSQNGVFRTLLPGYPISPLPPRPMPPVPNPRPMPMPIIVPPSAAAPVELSGYRVEGTIDDQVASLTYDITFHNPGGRRLEGVLIVPIPADTVLSGFTMTVGGKKMNGELLEADKAGAIYQDIVNRLRDPGLLELIGERMFRAKVFPIEPNGDVAVKLSMTQVLHKSGDLIGLTVPLRSAQIVQGTAGRGSVRIKLNASKPIRSLYSPSPDVGITKSDDRHAEISYEKPAADSDLSLFYSMREDPLAAGLLTFKEPGEDGYFLLSLSPRPHVDERRVAPKDVVFIVDRSGSMEESGKIEQARKALSYCLRRLSAQDRFGIVDFATDSNSFESRLVAATPDNKARALRYVERIEAAGGTNIEAALSDGLRLLAHDPARIPMVFFMTDGLPTVGQTDIQALLKKAAEFNADLRARLFSFGVGSDVNTLFLDKLAEMNRGSHDYVQPGEDIENKVSALYQKVSRPALSDVRLEWLGVDAVQVYPRPVTDLFYGSELVLMGRYKGRGKGSLVVTGQAGGRSSRFEFPVEFPGSASERSFLPRLWANLKVSHELDAIRLSGRADPEVIKEIVTLAKRHGIVTPYTSYLITEEGVNFQTAQNAAARSMSSLAFDAASSGFSGGLERAKAAQKASSFFGAAAGASVSGTGGGSANAPSMMALLKNAETQTRAELKDGGQDPASMRVVAGKTFYLRGGAWVDGDYELAENKASLRTVKVGYLSPEYFGLIQKHPGLSRYLAIGKNITLLFEGAVYQIADKAVSD